MDAALDVVRKTYAKRTKVMAASFRRELGNPNDFAKRAIDKLVAFAPGAPFFANNPNLSPLRLSFATADVAKIEEGVERLGEGVVDRLPFTGKRYMM